MPCCGKTLCYGCVLAAQDEISKGNMKPGAPFADYNGLPKNLNKTMKVLERAAELGSIKAHYHLEAICISLLSWVV